MRGLFKVVFKSRRIDDGQVVDTIEVSGISSEITQYTSVATVQRVIDLAAKRYVEENYADLVKSLDQDAIRAQVAIAVAVSIAKEMGR